MAETLLSEIRRRLVSEPSWRYFVGDGSAWLCPCCATSIHAEHATLGSLLGAITDHLELACPAWHAGGQWPTDETLRQRRDQAEVAFRLAQDPAFGISGSDGSWICPGCLQALPKVATSDDRQASVLAHRDVCEALAAWRIHSVAEVAASPHAAAGLRAPSGPAAAPAQSEVQHELGQARALQLHLMRDPPALPGYHIATYYAACTELSGDFNQFVRLGDGRLAFAQGDVSGHGVRAGLLMAMANKLVELFATQGLDSRQTVIQLHRAMTNDLGGGGSGSFITLVYAVLDPVRRLVTWVRAGHNPALVWRAASGAIEVLTPAGMAVGFPGEELFIAKLAEERTQLHPGDVFVLFTDGITEAMGHEDEQFGDDRLHAVIKACAALGPAALIDAIVTAVTAHLRGRAKDDDHSLIVIGVDS